MIRSRRSCLGVLGGALAGGLLPAAQTAPDFKSYGDADMEKFLKLARVLSVEQIGHGVTKPLQVQMVLNGAQHRAQIQVVDKDLPDFFPQSGPPVPMKDSWRFNVAAYKVDRLLDLKMAAVAVSRAFRSKPAAFMWWVDDVQFEEAERIQKDLQPPDRERFARQRALANVFDELIMNIDRNLANLLITKSWDIALIDHTRTFTAYHGIRNEAKLTRCSLGLMAKMRALSAGRVTAAVGPLLTTAEVAAIIARRDRIVTFFEQEAKKKGADNVFFS